MLQHWDNLVISSFSLYLDHQLVKNAGAYTNHSGLLYLSNTKYEDKHTYASPFSQFISDSSISGPIVMTGLYLSGSFIPTGTSGFFGVDYEKGRVYFNTPVAGGAISGQYAIKDFNVCVTSKPDEKILFEQKVNLRPKLSMTPTGLLDNQITYPLIYIKKEHTEDEAFAFGGTKQTNMTIKAIVMADTQFKIDAVEGYMRDLMHTNVPILNQEEMPYNRYGGLKSGVYHYDNLTSGKVTAGSGAWISNVYSTKLNKNLYNIDDLNPEVQLAMVFFELKAVKGFST
jgi:hypothetical protein